MLKFCILLFWVDHDWPLSSPKLWRSKHCYASWVRSISCTLATWVGIQKILWPITQIFAECSTIDLMIKGWLLTLYAQRTLLNHETAKQLIAVTKHPQTPKNHVWPSLTLNTNWQRLDLKLLVISILIWILILISMNYTVGAIIPF